MNYLQQWAHHLASKETSKPPRVSLPLPLLESAINRRDYLAEYAGVTNEHDLEHCLYEFLVQKAREEKHDVANAKVASSGDRLSKKIGWDGV